jgi:hypothetical protein
MPLFLGGRRLFNVEEHRAPRDFLLGSWWFEALVIGVGFGILFGAITALM